MIKYLFSFSGFNSGRVCKHEALVRRKLAVWVREQRFPEWDGYERLMREVFLLPEALRSDAIHCATSPSLLLGRQNWACPESFCKSRLP